MKEKKDKKSKSSKKEHKSKKGGGDADTGVDESGKAVQKLPHSKRVNKSRRGGEGVVSCVFNLPNGQKLEPMKP